MTTMDLVEFLLARIADDEAAARAARDRGSSAYDWASLRDRGFILADAHHIPRWSPTRTLAECSAKRRIMEGAEAIMGHEKTYADRMRHSTTEDATYVIARDMLRSLALPYADHPDYLEEWKP